MGLPLKTEKGATPGRSLFVFSKRLRAARRRFSKLVLDNLGDSAHRALLDAIAAGDAGVLVDSLGNTVDDLENLLRACVNANAAADALISFDYRV